jgi:hypothetical protein
VPLGDERARLGWPETAVTREFAILGEVLGAAVRSLEGAGEAAVVERAQAIVAHLLAQSLRVSLGGFRLVAGFGMRA